MAIVYVEKQRIPMYGGVQNESEVLLNEQKTSESNIIRKLFYKTKNVFRPRSIRNQFYKFTQMVRNSYGRMKLAVMNMFINKTAVTLISPK
ncbi:hypothetical protein ECANGB1_377 [Enterospora canceri]|uniref:Uncharacterized protein n=1 Tax=Enterospora canceri TaxID=1081671 RepID=A0A1Y1S3K1_9MICR|nr:hypothetical protein ECANGB1_377 [Enterospora canceri]